MIIHKRMSSCRRGSGKYYKSTKDNSRLTCLHCIRSLMKPGKIFFKNTRFELKIIKVIGPLVKYSTLTKKGITGKRWAAHIIRQEVLRNK